MNETFLRYMLRIDSLTVFSALRDDPVIHGLHELFAELAKADFSRLVSLYSNVLTALYPCGSDLSEYIRDLVLRDDNFYVQAVAAQRPLSDEIREAAEQEIGLLQELATLECREIREALGYDEFLPSWTCSKIDLSADFAQRLEKLPVTGFGVFAEYTFFRIADGEGMGVLPGQGIGGGAGYRIPGAVRQGQSVLGGFGPGASSGHGLIVPVPHPDVQPLHELYGYEREKELILRNTEALLDGTGASNMLLYGDAGTGKSSTIKAVAAEYADRGLRIIEVRKNQLFRIPEILTRLAENPLKFILFIDDLSFTGNDDNFSALKATLEGSVAGCTGNTVIYATSNRRHLVKENFADRAGDELHVNDTLQETMSLAARFGLTITFSKPDKDEYLDIVRALAAEYGIDLPDAELVRRAEAHAIRRSGRSPRTAKQFVELLKIGI